MDARKWSGVPAKGKKVLREISQTWANFMDYCERTKFGELACVQIQDGEPVSVERVKKKLKFTPAQG